MIKIKKLLKEKRLLTKRDIHEYKMNKEYSVNIDDYLEFLYANNYEYKRK